MIALIRSSQAAKTRGCAVTYRQGAGNQWGTCPSSCPLLPPDATGTPEIDLAYFESVSRAVPRGGHAWTYTHFLPYLWNHLNGPGRTVINASATGFRLAAKYAKRGIPTVLDVPPDTPKHLTRDGVRFVRCPASATFGCIDCGGVAGPLCARQNRNYVVMFPWHGTKERLSKMVRAACASCYGAAGNVFLHWQRYAKQVPDSLSDGERVEAFAKVLPPHTRLRHHVVGDGGADRV